MAQVSILWTISVAALLFSIECVISGCDSISSDRKLRTIDKISLLREANDSLNSHFQHKNWEAIHRSELIAYHNGVGPKRVPYRDFLDLMSKAYGIGTIDSIRFIKFDMQGDSAAVTTNYLVFTAHAPEGSAYRDTTLRRTFFNNWIFKKDTWYIYDWNWRKEVDEAVYLDTLDPIQKKLWESEQETFESKN